MNIKLDSVSDHATRDPSVVLTTLSSKDHVHAKRGTARPLDDVVMSDAETEQVRSSSLVCHPNGRLIEPVHFQSDADSDCSAHGATGSACLQSPPLHGCAFLQVVQQQLQNYATTNGACGHLPSSLIPLSYLLLHRRVPGSHLHAPANVHALALRAR